MLKQDAENRAELIVRCRAKVAVRAPPGSFARELDHGVTVFLDQLIKTLQVEQTSESGRSREVSGAAGGGQQASSEIGTSAAAHGLELLQSGFTVEELVHDYGDLCQAITDLAVERETPFSMEEFRTLNRCLDNAIAKAITEYSYQHDSIVADRHADAFNLRLGQFAHELRNHLGTATLAVMAIRTGKVGLASATGAVLDRSLVNLRNLLQNAFKFTRAGSKVTIQAYAAADRILIDVKDECGGLPDGDAEAMFAPFRQAGDDRTGLGLGLAIARRGVEANQGRLAARDLPGHGCVFTIDLPRHSMLQ